MDIDSTDTGNPTSFFRLVKGDKMKRSSCGWDNGMDWAEFRNLCGTLVTHAHFDSDFYHRKPNSNFPVYLLVNLTINDSHHTYFWYSILRVLKPVEAIVAEAKFVCFHKEEGRGRGAVPALDGYSSHVMQRGQIDLVHTRQTDRHVE